MRVKRAWEIEEKITQQILKARQLLDVKMLLSVCSESIVYDSQSMLSPIRGLDDFGLYIAKYFRRLESWKLMGVLAHHEISLGKFDLVGRQGYPCIVFDIDGRREQTWHISVDEECLVTNIFVCTLPSIVMSARIVKAKYL